MIKNVPAVPMPDEAARPGASAVGGEGADRPGAGAADGSSGGSAAPGSGGGQSSPQPGARWTGPGHPGAQPPGSAPPGAYPPGAYPPATYPPGMPLFGSYPPGLPALGPPPGMPQVVEGLPTFHGWPGVPADEIAGREMQQRQAAFWREMGAPPAQGPPGYPSDPAGPRPVLSQGEIEQIRASLIGTGDRDLARERAHTLGVWSLVIGAGSFIIGPLFGPIGLFTGYLAWRAGEVRLGRLGFLLSAAGIVTWAVLVLALKNSV